MFLLNATATTEIYTYCHTLSLHDALPISALGGLLGVMFSIPLRRALVAESDLPYPEGRAAAEVLKVGEGSRAGDAESSAGLRVIVTSTLVAAAFNALTYMRLAVSEASHFFRIGPSATGIAGGL